MHELFRGLVRDTLTVLKDPLLPKQAILASAKDVVFFKEAREIKEEVPAPPLLPPMASAAPTVPKKAVPQKDPNPVVVEEIKVQKPAQEANISDIKKTLQKIAPSIKFSEEVPDDKEARRIASAYQEKIPDAEVILLVCNSDTETMEFIKTLAKAIDQKLAKVKILAAGRLEREKRWDLFFAKNSFRLIIASNEIQKFPELMRFYRASPATGQFFLHKSPLIVLSPISTYQAVQQKALLWKSLCQKIES